MGCLRAGVPSRHPPPPSLRRARAPAEIAFVESWDLNPAEDPCRRLPEAVRRFEVGR